MAPKPPKVLISYSHDSPEHEQRVLGLAERLRKDGVDVQLDQYVAGTPTRGWPRWMNDQLDSVEFVLVVCTETYQRRFLGREEPDKGKGADWEGSLITFELYHARSETNKFVPVFFNRQDESFIPRLLSGHTRYLLSSEDNYAKLYDFLIGQAGVVPGTLGPLKTRARGPVGALMFEDAEPARQAAAIPSSTIDLDFVRSQLLGLSAEYAKIRENIPSGDARSRQMEIIVTKMRSVALPATPLLRSLANSRVPGERLAAISILQVTPQTEYIEWLGERCLEGQPLGQPFLVYHAAVALLTSARTLDCVHRPRLEGAIQKGLAHLGNKQSTDRYRTLAGALEELRARCPQS
jgi:SEFIR domain